jgi:hypothetical protein
MTSMVRGECNCGAVRFEVDGDLDGVYVCHCSICRRSSGANGMAVVLAANERFRWTAGQAQIAAWTKPGTQWEKWFCRTCGTPVPGANDPTRVFIPAGCITQGGDALRVRHHVWVGSKAAWDEIGDDGKRHVERFRKDGAAE